MKIVYLPLLLLVLLTTIMSAVYGDTIELKNGEVFIGSFLRADDQVFTFETSDGVKKFRAADIQRLTFGVYEVKPVPLARPFSLYRQ